MTKTQVKPEANEASKAKYIVLVPFRDISNYENAYNKGDDVSHFNAERLDHLVKHNMVKQK